VRGLRDMLPLILASTSPRRRRLLLEHGYNFRVIPADVNEIAPAHLSPGEITLFNARSKASAIAHRHPRALVIGVDTIVSFEGKVFGKPATMGEALTMLRRLNGRAHEVYSGVWLRHAATGKERGFIDITRVHSASSRSRNCALISTGSARWTRPGPTPRRKIAANLSPEWKDRSAM